MLNFQAFMELLDKYFDRIVAIGDKYFDKLLMACLFVYMVCIVILFALMAGVDSGTVQWARETANLIIGGLVGLVTGVAIGRHQMSKDTKDNGDSQ